MRPFQTLLTTTHDTMESPELPAALLRWVKSFDFAVSIASIKDLQDGVVFWKILGQVEPGYFSGDLPEATASTVDNWIPRWQNLKHIDRLVTAYIRDECNKLPELSRKMTPDLKAIAIDGSRDDTIQVGLSRILTLILADSTMQLLKLILLAALYSPVSNDRMVRTMTKLPGDAATYIAGMISSLENSDRQLAEEKEANGGSDVDGMMSPERSGTPSIPSLQRDPELEREEQLIKAIATIRDRDTKIAALTGELKKKSAHALQLQDELTTAKNTLESGGLSGTNNQILEQLRQKSVQDKDYIAELESDVSMHKEASEDRQRQLARLKADADSKQKLRDELQMLRAERDDLLQRSKASENLKKKIQTLQESDRINTSLRNDLDAAQEGLRAGKSFKVRCVALQKANEELMKTISNGEQEIFDMKTYRKRLDHELKVVLQRFEVAKERQARDSETISEQEERIRQLEEGQNKDTVDTSNLDDELEIGDNSHQDLRSRLAELEAENAHLKETPAVETHDTTVHKKVEMLKERCIDLEKKYLDAYQENLGLDAALKDARGGVEDSPPFVELRDRLRTETTKLTKTEKRLFEAEGELADTKVKLGATESKVAAMDEERKDPFDELQRSHRANTIILEREKDRLALHGKSVEFQLDEHKDLLRHSLLKRNALLREDVEIRATNEFRLISHEINSFKHEPSSSEEELALSLAHRVEDSHKKVKEVEAEAAQVRRPSRNTQTHGHRIPRRSDMAWSTPLSEGFKVEYLRRKKTLADELSLTTDSLGTRDTDR